MAACERLTSVWAGPEQSGFRFSRFLETSSVLNPPDNKQTTWWMWRLCALGFKRLTREFQRENVWFSWELRVALMGVLSIARTDERSESEERWAGESEEEKQIVKFIQLISESHKDDSSAALLRAHLLLRAAARILEKPETRVCRRQIESFRKKTNHFCLLYFSFKRSPVSSSRSPKRCCKAFWMKQT